MHLSARLPLAFTLLLGAVLAGSACDSSIECRADGDCGAGLVCSVGQCVECGGNDDCAGDEFCCRGVCRPADELEEHCGCGAAPGGSAGEDCGEVEPAGLCLVDGITATVATVADGTCGCGCTPAMGGPICTLGEAGAEPICSCADNPDCRTASDDIEGQPHRATDTCTPGGTCVCFSLGTAEACDPNGETPDCTSAGGCHSLSDDAENCGVPARNCASAATGVADTGVCMNGGCTCDDAGDCSGTGINVSTCAFVAVGEPARCVCAGYTANGLQAPCPMELECVTGGCTLDGTAYATQEELRGALGLSVDM